MTEDQFSVWLLFFVAPVLIVFCNNDITFHEMLIIGLTYSIFPIAMFFLGEKEFINDCKKNYKEFEDSIFPIWVYRRYLND